MAPLTLSQAIRHLQQGSILAYPTESSYGLGCDPWNPQAIAQVFHMKNRPSEKPLLLVVAHLEQICVLTPLNITEIASIFLQGANTPTTYLIPAAEKLPPILTAGQDFIGVRLSQHSDVQALCTAFGGAIVSTSANPSDSPAAMTPEELEHYWPHIHTYGQQPWGKPPSTIIHSQTGQKLRG